MPIDLNELEALYISRKFTLGSVPDTVLGLIAELRQVKAERDWLADRLGNLNEESSHSELCPDKFTTETVCKQTTKCNTCWLKAAKEAVKND